MKLVVTCEHAFPDIPKKYQYLFISEPEILSTHEAFDLGAYDIYKTLQPLSDFSIHQEVGRLLVETNRSQWNRKLFSRFSTVLPDEDKKEILEDYYYSYREKVQESIMNYILNGDKVLHLSVHSFTPELFGRRRNADIGVLYDPANIWEKELALKLKAIMQKKAPDIKVRFNYPYLGKADGFTTSLRKSFPENYAGIELEINQKWSENNKMEEVIRNLVYDSIKNLKKA